LFIGISQEGGSAPNDQILSGLTPLPDQMALGATWNRELAQDVGTVMGRELSTIGFNLYLGLSLDVLTLNNAAINSDLSTRVFGGDPYWVGELGKAYLSGLHQGSNNHMLVIVKHFPGRGGSDRPAWQEIPTVRRSLEELKSIELAPFFAVTGNASDAASTADGLLVSHIRYQGFQGNIRATTRPISFDQQALNQVLSLPALADWRQNGGLIISDNLGTQAVRRFYDPDLVNFSGRLVARDAFLAGNDLIYMGNIISSNVPDTYTTVLRTLEFFEQKYREDPAFASRVDESVHRILSAKYKLYGSFDQPVLQPDPSELDKLGTGNETVFAVARQSATLISPNLADLANVLPTPPNAFDYIIFLTDSRTMRQCSTCPDMQVLGKDSLRNVVQRLYGPSAGGLVVPSHLSSYSFDDLNLFLTDLLPTPDLPNDLRRATWVIISTLDLSENSPQMFTLRRFLSEKQSLLASKKVILFSFSAPYYLDATDISKLTAYYGMYSESDPFVDVAARLLYQELAPAGSLPVSVPGIGYDLISATAPDPNQVIKLTLDLPPATPTPEGGVTAEPTAAPLFRVGDTISLRTGVILDHNQRPVPDGTPVRFTFSQGESSLPQQMEAVTSQGTAVTTFRLEKSGLIEIRAMSEPARVSDTIQLNVTSEGTVVNIITPTSEATPVPTAIPPTLVPAPTPVEPIVTTNGYPNFLGWFLVLLVLLAGTGLVFWLGGQVVEPRWAVRWALLVFLGGLAAYNYLILGFPGGNGWLAGRGFPAFLQAVLIGQGIGFAAGWIWRLAAEGGDQAQEQKNS
jgi:beta-N-acetylhexosaminidase